MNLEKNIFEELLNAKTEFEFIQILLKEKNFSGRLERGAKFKRKI